MTPTDDDVFEIIRREWRAAAKDLADWAMDHLVNRLDVWGQYTPLTAKEKLNSTKTYKALTLPQKSKRGSDMVTLDKLTRHFRSTGVKHLIGLHAAHPDNTAKWLALDIDLHEPEAADAEDAARRNFAAALAWWEELQTLGYDPLLLDSNGAGGYHLLTLFAQPAPLADVHALGQRLVGSWKEKNIDGPPEHFPKSAELLEGKLGAWLRVFGMHHTRLHFTKVWSGDPWLDEPWLEGSAAIEAIMSVRPGSPPPTGKPSDSRPDLPNQGTTRKSRFESKRQDKPFVCVDLDGVLARYEGWSGKEQIGEPIPGALEFMRTLTTFAKAVIHTSRVETDKDARLIEAWLDTHAIPFDHVHVGPAKPKAVAFIDDRAVSCHPQVLGPAAFASAELAVRALCQERDPEWEGSLAGGLGRVIASWDTLTDAQRRAVLDILPS